MYKWPPEIQKLKFMTQNKTHWYDGWFYDRLIAPNQDRLFGQSYISKITKNTFIFLQTKKQ
jgi:hypothetical protein